METSRGVTLSRAEVSAIIDNARELLSLEATMLETHLRQTIAQYIRLRNVAYLDQQRLEAVKQKNSRITQSLEQLKDDMYKGTDGVQVSR